MKIDFIYQNHWLRWIWALPLIEVISVIQTFFTEKVQVHIWSILIINILIPLLVFSIYYSFTNRLSFYKKKGSCYVYENKVDIFLTKKKYTVRIEDISDIYLCARSTFGLEYLIFRIKYKEKVIKIVGTSMEKNFNIDQTEFGKIFCLISRYATHLNHSKDIFGNDIPYWLQKDNS